MKTKESFYPALRIAALTLIFIAVSAAQNAVCVQHKLPIVLLVPLTVCVCSFEGEFAGLFFGIAGGALYDAASPAPDGVFTLLFAVLGCASGLLMRYVLRNTALSVFLLTLAFSFMTSLTAFVFIASAGDLTEATSVFTGTYLKSAVLTVFTLPVFYFPVKFIETRLRKL
ncbi:MAG: hypothetical protein IJS90_00635 [Clostridia bacterium]|nr:hypothetical protein [Clostridia bacterium]